MQERKLESCGNGVKVDVSLETKPVILEVNDIQ